MKIALNGKRPAAELFISSVCLRFSAKLRLEKKHMKTCTDRGSNEKKSVQFHFERYPLEYYGEKSEIGDVYDKLVTFPVFST